MDLYDVAIARKLSGGGGGGSSDFTTAEVRLLCDNENYDLESASLSSITDFYEDFGIDASFGKIYFGNAEEGATVYNAILYKGKAVLDFSVGIQSSDISTTGSVQLISGMGSRVLYAIITGDCTITIS